MSLELEDMLVCEDYVQSSSDASLPSGLLFGQWIILKISEATKFKLTNMYQFTDHVKSSGSKTAYGPLNGYFVLLSDIMISDIPQKAANISTAWWSSYCLSIKFI